jgi:hypothetical protein
MSRGKANENEAAVAGAKVQQLLIEFGLTLADVEASGVGGKIIEDGDLMTSSSNPWRRFLALATARLYLSDYYYGHVYRETTSRKCGYVRGDQHFFVGLPHNVVVAKEMFIYFVDTIERLAKESRKKQGQNHAYEHAFRHGCAVRLTERLTKMYSQQTEAPAGLISKSGVPALYKGMDERISAHMEAKELTVKKDRGKQSSWAGVIAGNRAAEGISLDTQLSEGEKQKVIT